LKQRFGEDANLAKTLVMVLLRAAFGMRIEKADRPSYLAALERLPKHTTMKPGFPLISKAGDELTTLFHTRGGRRLGNRFPNALGGTQLVVKRPPTRRLENC
jgi:hypothetical protein